jgi:hypothetical protein
MRHSVPPAQPPSARRRSRGLIALGTAAATAFAGLMLVVLPASSASAAASSATAYQSPGTPSPSVAGATTPFTTYQAPEGQLGGGASVVSLTSAPTSEYDSPQGEATGHAYVQLTGPGQSVQWTNETGTPIDFVNIRASIPDSSAGGGMTATLDLYVNGTFRQAINMNSIQTWQYEGNGNYNSSVPDQNASDGDPRDFWDDFNAFVTGTPIAPGSTISLVKDSTNTASFYWINSIDLFDAPAPIAQPANSISITSCGATADDTPTNGTAAPGATDSTADIQNCVSQAEAQNKILWIPQGTFYVIGTQSIPITNITIEGAGYLYSELYRDVPLPNNTPLGSLLQCYSCHIQDFHIDTNSLSRGESDGGGGAEDTTGTNWSIENMWVQHVESSLWASGTGGTVEDNFFTDIFADGCNINNVSLTGTSGSNITVENNYIRGTGDDAMAINSVAYNGSTTYTAMTNITMEHNTLLAPWGGKGIGIYGGSGHHVEDNYIADTARYIGLGIGRFGVNGSDMTGATVSGNVVVRSGGNAYFQGQPAMQIGNGGDGQNVGVVSNADVTDNTIINPVYDGLDVSTSTSSTFSDNQIIDPWRDGIVISPQYYPAPSGNGTFVNNSVTGLASGMSAYLNDSNGGFTATTSGDSWQNGTAEAPYGGSAAAVPGTVQAENYDTGGQGIAYNVNSVNGTDNGYRSDGVDLETTSDTGGGNDLAWTAAGQWFKYTVDVATAGTYTLNIRASSASGVSDAFHLTDSAGDALTGAENIPATGGGQTWTTVSDTVTLAAGQQTITLDQDNPGWSLNYLAFASGSGSTSGPVLTASPGALSFPSEVVGTAAPSQTVTVTNSGTTSATVSSVAATGPYTETNNCSTVAVDGSCTVTVGFTPTASGADPGTLTITSNATDSPTTVSLSGTGIGSGTNLALAGTMTASSSASGYPASNANDGNTSTYWESLDGSAYPQTLTANLGQSAALGSVTLTLPPATAWSTRTETLSVLGSTNGSSWTTVVPSAGYTFNPATGNTVSFSLPSGTDDQYLELSFTANTGWTAAQVSEFEIFPATGGTGTGGTAALAASPTSLSFGSQNTGTTSAAQSVTISNTGSAPATISAVASTAPFAQTNTCGSSLAAGTACTASVTFAPTSAGASTGSLTVTSNAGNGTLTVALSGTGTASSTTDLALNQPVSASSYTQSYVPANAVDGNTSTYWESVDGNWPATFTVDLGSSTTIGSLVLDLPPSSAWQTRTQTLSVLGSANDSTWTTLVASATYTWNPSTGNTVTIALPSGTSDRYVELDFTANNVQNGAQLSELEVFS